jgi:hypothetical protein
MKTDDIVAIQQLFALYGHVQDGRDWDQLGLIVTEDVHFDARNIGGPELHSLAEWRAYLEHVWCPVAHLMTNVYITPGAFEDEAKVHAKFITVMPDGTCHTGDYHDVAVRTDAGWLISEHTYVGRLVFTGDEAANYAKR